MKFSNSNAVDCGFGANLLTGGGSLDSYRYAFIAPSNSIAPGNSYILFKVSYNIHYKNGKTSGWKAIKHDGTVESNNSSNLKDYLFTFTRGTPSEIIVHYPSISSSDTRKSYPNKTKKTGNAGNNDVIKVGTYKELTGQSGDVYKENSLGSNESYIRLDCDALGWFETSGNKAVKYVDIHLTFFSYTELNRSYTFPIKLWNDTKLGIVLD